MGSFGTKNRIQILNPAAKLYLLIDTKTGATIHYRRKPYKNVPIVGKNWHEEAHTKDMAYTTFSDAHKQVIETEEPIHEFFELSHASYLVLPRSVLQSMPVKWQKKFVELMDETEKLIGRYPQEGLHYKVILNNVLGHKVDDPLEDYERGRRRLPYKGI